MPGKILTVLAVVFGLAVPMGLAQAQDAPTLLVTPDGQSTQPAAMERPEVLKAKLDPALPATSDYEPFLVVLNKAEILNLPAAARTIIISNPNVIDISLETSRMGILRGLTVGESALIIMDSRHEKLFTANVIVIPEPSRHVTITRDCTGANKGCAVEEEFSCGPRCVRVANPNEVEASNATNVAPNGGPASGGGASAPAIADPAAALAGG